MCLTAFSKKCAATTSEAVPVQAEAMVISRLGAYARLEPNKVLNHSQCSLASCSNSVPYRKDSALASLHLFLSTRSETSPSIRVLSGRNVLLRGKDKDMVITLRYP